MLLNYIRRHLRIEKKTILQTREHRQGVLMNITTDSYTVYYKTNVLLFFNVMDQTPNSPTKIIYHIPGEIINGK